MNTIRGWTLLVALFLLGSALPSAFAASNSDQPATGLFILTPLAKATVPCNAAQKTYTASLTCYGEKSIESVAIWWEKKDDPTKHDYKVGPSDLTLTFTCSTPGHYVIHAAGGGVTREAPLDVVGVKSVQSNFLSQTNIAGQPVYAWATPDPEDADWPTGFPVWSLSPVITGQPTYIHPNWDIKILTDASFTGDLTATASCDIGYSPQSATFEFSTGNYSLSPDPLPAFDWTPGGTRVNPIPGLDGIESELSEWETELSLAVDSAKYAAEYFEWIGHWIAAGSEAVTPILITIEYANALELAQEAQARFDAAQAHLTQIEADYEALLVVQHTQPGDEILNGQRDPNHSFSIGITNVVMETTDGRWPVDSPVTATIASFDEYGNFTVNVHATGNYGQCDVVLYDDQQMQRAKSHVTTTGVRKQDVVQAVDNFNQIAVTAAQTSVADAHLQVAQAKEAMVLSMLLTVVLLLILGVGSAVLLPVIAVFGAVLFTIEAIMYIVDKFHDAGETHKQEGAALPDSANNVP